jgi:outer membrane biosynthesis protein TonB
MVRAVSVSFLLHLLLLYWLSHSGKLIIFKAQAEAVPVPEKRIAFELVETPENSPEEEPSESTNLISDKQNRASDMSPESDPSGLPSSEGMVPVKSLPPGSEASAAAESPSPTGRSRPVEESSGEWASVQQVPRSSSPRFSREMLLGERSPPGTKDMPYEQRKFSAEDLGGIRFNTYAWEWAPYLLELKRRIQRNIYPPPAFTQLGFGGTNQLRFRIHPSGRLEGPVILGYHGEKALVETSKKAVEVSAPFPPLPEDFPEKFLEVTARFDYFIIAKK